MAEFKDDPSIEDHDILWRNVLSLHTVPGKISGTWRVSSAAFKDDPDGDPMSVTIAAVAVKIGLTPTRQLDGRVDFSLASITAGLARSCKQGVLRNPLVENPAHGKVFGEKPRSIRRRLANEAQWVLLRPPARE